MKKNRVVMNKRKMAVSSRNRKKKRPWVRKLLFWLPFLIFVGSFFYVIFFSSFLSITSVEVSGAKDLSSQEIVEKVKSGIFGEYLNFFPKDNFLLVRSGKIKRDLLGSFPKLKYVQVKKIFPHGLAVSVAERKTALIACSLGGPEDVCYAIDENGQAFEKWSGVDSGIAVLRCNSGEKIDVHDFVLEKKNISAMDFLHLQGERISGVKMKNVFETPSFISGDVRVASVEGWKIFFNINLNLEKELEALRLVLDKKISPNRRSQLEYVDLRVENKVYYKFKGDDGVNADQEGKNIDNKNTD